MFPPSRLRFTTRTLAVALAVTVPALAQSNRPKATVWTLNGTSPDANTGAQLFQAPGIEWARQAEFEKRARFSKGGPDEIKLQSAEAGAGNRFDHTFPAHSITTFELAVQ